ncbi:MAG: ATP-dependent 6-phosphofructokinase [Chloroflexi bacterium]|jgi:6-phosphofructokinase 1|nr:ATP-dependent 6-phosphofructokinase [Chloroflexota bacterium]
MTKKIGILTAGSDCPGLNAAIRGFGKTAEQVHGMQLIGFRDGFEGLLSNHTVNLGGEALSNILTAGGTILGTSRLVPHHIEKDGEILDKTDDVLAVYKENKLDGLVCIGGRETMDTAQHLQSAGLNVLTLPKSGVNDMPLTDVTIGFDTAKMIATEAIDRLHSTANSTHSIIIVEILGREVGWLTLTAGVAGGADVILIPEIPYTIDNISEAILKRNKAGKVFSIVAVAEGAQSSELVAFFERSMKKSQQVHEGESPNVGRERMAELRRQYSGETLMLANRLESSTGIKSRITILGYLLRGGAPSATDRVLATQLGSYAADLVSENKYGVMVGIQNGKVATAPIEAVAQAEKPVPLDDPWLTSARKVGTIFGD